jgi:hypothetical protein
MTEPGILKLSFATDVNVATEHLEKEIKLKMNPKMDFGADGLVFY